MSDRPRVAVFRPDDERMAEAIRLLESLGAEPLADPMLAVEPTGAVPRADADFVILTSKTGIDLLPDDWTAREATLCAIGERTAMALRDSGRAVDLVPDTYSSRGLLDALDGRVDGARVEVARSDHGSATLLDGLRDAGAYHHETVLYRLVRPPESGRSAELAADGALDATLFTSSLTVTHFLDAAAERGLEADVLAGLEGTLVGAIGPTTRDTLESCGLAADVVPDTASFEALARAAVARLRE